MNANTVDQEVLTYIIKNLVSYPDKVVIERKVDEMGVLLTLSVHAEDMGLVIGRNGSMAKALRTIIKAVGKKHRMMVSLNIIEPANGQKSGRVYKDEDRMGSSDAAESVVLPDPEPISVSDDLAEFAIN
ncbi:MAG: hypothetical protein OHK0017_02240 [Patescibacteria group bacterium]